MKMKDVMKTVDVLIKFNDWHTGSDIPQPSPKKLTKHINRAAIMLVKYAEVLEQQETNPICISNQNTVFKSALEDFYRGYTKSATLFNSVVVPKEEKFKLGDIIQSVDGRRIVITENNNVKLRGYEIGGQLLLMEFYPDYIKYKE